MASFSPLSFLSTASFCPTGSTDGGDRMMKLQTELQRSSSTQASRQSRSYRLKKGEHFVPAKHILDAYSLFQSSIFIFVSQCKHHRQVTDFEWVKNKWAFCAAASGVSFLPLHFRVIKKKKAQVQVVFRSWAPRPIIISQSHSQQQIFISEEKEFPRRIFNRRPFNPVLVSLLLFLGNLCQTYEDDDSKQHEEGK